MNCKNAEQMNRRIMNVEVSVVFNIQHLKFDIQYY
jgi:hypothetical protein